MRNTFINDYFGFNRQQRNGLWVLMLISFTLFVIRLAYPYFIKPAKIEVLNLPLQERRIDSATARSEKYGKTNSEDAKHGDLFVFDPNTVSAEQLQQLGFREKTAITLVKFRKKGFVFKEKKDLLKVYGISGKFYAALEPYILIKNERSGNDGIAPKQTPVLSTAPQKAAAVKTELNTADSLALIELNGIGPAFAKRILKYRSILGGYASVEQLREVYGFTDELFEKVKNSVKVDASLLKKTDLNKDDFKTINKHPYLSYEITKAIFNARRQTPVTPENLKDILNDEVLYNKLLPYVVF